VNYDNPISGVSVASVAAAAGDLPFAPVVPRNLGSAKGLFITDSPADEKGNRAAAFIYDTDAYGRVTVTEGLPPVPADEYDADQARRVLSPPTDVTVRGKAELVTIRGNVQAVVSLEDDGTLNNVHWLQNGVEVFLRGPTLTRDQALEIANGL
jgi:hypothetical protein